MLINTLVHSFRPDWVVMSLFLFSGFAKLFPTPSRLSPLHSLPRDNVVHLCGNTHANDVGVSGVKCQWKSDCPVAATAPCSVGHQHVPKPGVPPDVSLLPPLRMKPCQVYSWLIRIPPIYANPPPLSHWEIWSPLLFIYLFREGFHQRNALTFRIHWGNPTAAAATVAGVPGRL